MGKIKTSGVVAPKSIRGTPGSSLQGAKRTVIQPALQGTQFTLQKGLKISRVAPNNTGTKAG